MVFAAAEQMNLNQCGFVWLLFGKLEKFQVWKMCGSATKFVQFNGNQKFQINTSNSNFKQTAFASTAYNKYTTKN